MISERARKGLIKRCNQPLAPPIRSFNMTSTLPLQIMLALACRGLSLSR
jgi:hypothetical protein